MGWGRGKVRVRQLPTVSGVSINQVILPWAVCPRAVFPGEGVLPAQCRDLLFPVAKVALVVWRSAGRPVVCACAIAGEQPRWQVPETTRPTS